MPQNSVDALKAAPPVLARMAGSYSTSGSLIQRHVPTRTSPWTVERANLCAGNLPADINLYAA
jgi:hypothetical protein